LDDNNRTQRQKDHNYSNIFNEKQGSLGPRGNSSIGNVKKNVSQQFFYGSTQGMQKPNNTNGDMFGVSKENTLLTSLHGKRDIKMSTTYGDVTKSIRDNYRSVRQIKDQAFSLNPEKKELSYTNNNVLADNGQFHKYRKNLPRDKEGDLVKLVINNAEHVDTLK